MAEQAAATAVRAVAAQVKRVRSWFQVLAGVATELHHLLLVRPRLVVAAVVAVTQTRLLVLVALVVAVRALIIHLQMVFPERLLLAAAAVALVQERLVLVVLALSFSGGRQAAVLLHQRLVPRHTTTVLADTTYTHSTARAQ
jgi:hypothetical protein